MNQIKIGKFIMELRKEKQLTQNELAEKIGVTDRAISKWENGRGMPDISLIKTLSETLGVTVNELLTGERIKEKDKNNKLEESYIDSIETKTKLQSDIVGYLIYKIIGYILLFTGIGFFGTNKLWVNLFVLIGFLFIIISSYKLVRNQKIYFKTILITITFLILIAIISYFDYQYVADQIISKPHFYYSKTKKNNCTLYKTLTFSCLNVDGKECYIIIKNSDYIDSKKPLESEWCNN